MARRLLLSYLALIALTVAAMAFIIYAATAQTFSHYLSDQAAAHSEMLPVMLAGYQSRYGSWDGVQPNIDEASVLIGAQVTLADAQGRIVAATRRDLVGQMESSDLALGLPISVVGSGGKIVGTVYVGRSLAQQRADAAFLSNVTLELASAGLIVGLLAAGLGVVLARSTSRPLGEMGRAAGRMSQGDYAVRVSFKGQDEVAALARAFNQMAEGMAGVERLRQELVANVSHDLRTPLTVINGYLEGLRSGLIADRQSAEMAFEAMHAEVTRLLRLVDDLRQVTVLDAGMLPLERKSSTVADLTFSVLDRIGPLAAAKGIVLANEVSTHLPALSLDWERMGQVIFNLLENAVRYTAPGGTITVRAGRAEYPNGRGEHLWLAVQDTGEGIPPEHLPHIFDRFYRGDRSRSKAGGGAGLGLAIVQGIVEAHGGQVTAESEGIAGRGSTFTIHLPLA